MYKYKYWSNKTKYHEELLFECVCDSILKADKLFEETIGTDPMKLSWVSCEVKKEESLP